MASESTFVVQKLTPSSSLVRTRAFQARCAGSNPAGVTINVLKRSKKIFDVIFYEVFDEEQTALKQFLPRNIQARFTKHTIQEIQDNLPLAKFISIRTQSIIPQN